MEVFGVALGLSVVAWILIAAVSALLLPALWLWMLIDSALRDVADFPSSDMAEKIAWIVLMVVLQPVAALYFFMVWLPARRKSTSPRASHPTGTVAAA
jgi:hypothetical protein